MKLLIKLLGLIWVDEDVFYSTTWIGNFFCRMAVKQGKFERSKPCGAPKQYYWLKK